MIEIILAAFVSGTQPWCLVSAQDRWECNFPTRGACEHARQGRVLDYVCLPRQAAPVDKPKKTSL